MTFAAAVALLLASDEQNDVDELIEARDVVLEGVAPVLNECRAAYREHLTAKKRYDKARSDLSAALNALESYAVPGGGCR